MDESLENWPEGSARQVGDTEHVRKRLSLAAAVIVAAAVALAAAGVWLDPQLRERLARDTVEARVGDYAEAVMRGDSARAVEAWQLDARRPDDALTARRASLTATLTGLRARRYQIERVEWWRTCCEPDVIEDPANAGLARAVVRFDSDTGSRRYVFDVLARDTVYWGDAAGSPPHHWTLRDVYPTGERPLYARFADVWSTFPDVVGAVQEYYDRYGEALVACDVRPLWERYPALASGTDLAAGINIEGVHVKGWCGTGVIATRFELERVAPLRIHAHGDTVDVTAHGFETFDTPGGSAGEFQTTITLRKVDGEWMVVRTDEVTLPEWHAQRH